VLSLCAGKEAMSDFCPATASVLGLRTEEGLATKVEAGVRWVLPL